MAAQVQAETIPDAMRPGLTDREADVNSSEFLGENPVYLDWTAVNPTMRALKNKPIPSSAWALEVHRPSRMQICTYQPLEPDVQLEFAIRVNVARTNTISRTLRECLTLRHFCAESSTGST